MHLHPLILTLTFTLVLIITIILALIPENFSEYVDTLESTAMWGGEMELRALSNEFERPIEVCTGWG